MSFKEWLEENLEEGERRDLARFGASAGFHGLIYYVDTVNLFDRYEDELWDMMYDIADGLGYDNALDFLGSCQGGEVGSTAQFKNLVVWVAAETYCRQGI